MRVLAFARPNLGLVAIGSTILAILVALVVAIPLSGVRPYGEQAMLEQIDQEDSTLCDNLGLRQETKVYRLHA